MIREYIFTENHKSVPARIRGPTLLHSSVNYKRGSVPTKYGVRIRLSSPS